MYGLYIVVENAEARRDRVGPFTAEMRETVDTYEQAHQALDRILELMGIEESETDVDPDGTVWPAQTERYGRSV